MELYHKSSARCTVFSGGCANCELQSQMHWIIHFTRFTDKGHLCYTSRMKHPVTICTVVRNKDLFARNITANPHCAQFEIYMCDNLTENKSIPLHYNSFLNAFDYQSPRWIVFCHEDFELQEDISPLLEKLSPNAIYGPCGARQKKLLGIITKSEIIGQINESFKDGANERTIGQAAPTGIVVDTLDCCCLIVHSTLIKKHNLRFDENLSFDLYAEDFSINAFLFADISTRIVNINCCHHSTPQRLPNSYIRSLKFLNKKYRNHCFAGTCTCIGNCLLSKAYCTPLILVKQILERIKFI